MARKTKKEESGIKGALIPLIILSALIILGVEGCPQSNASQSGIDFTLVSALDKLSAGKIVEQGETFGVHVRVENYDKQERSGKICIRDDMDDAYEGIKGEDCITFSIDAAESLGEKKSFGFGSTETIEPSVADIYFPLSGDYKYSQVSLTSQPATLFVILSYVQSSRAEASIKFPEPQTEMLQLAQEAAPITSSVEKSITSKETSYQISLGIWLMKQQDAEIFSPDFKEKEVLSFKAEMPPKSLSCEYDTEKDKQAKGLVELKNKKFIKCSSLVSKEGQSTLPFILTLDYGVKITKEFPFTIKAKK